MASIKLSFKTFGHIFHIIIITIASEMPTRNKSAKSTTKSPANGVKIDSCRTIQHEDPLKESLQRSQTIPNNPNVTKIFSQPKIELIFNQKLVKNWASLIEFIQKLEPD